LRLMKKSTFILFAIALISFGCSNQRATAAGYDSKSNYSQAQGKDVNDRMKERLDLRPDQIEPVKAINEKYRAQLADLKASGGSRMSKMTEAKKIMKDKNAEMEQVLTAEQYNEYLKLTAEIRKELRGRK